VVEADDSDGDSKPAKLKRLPTFDDKFKLNDKRIEIDAGKLGEDEQVDSQQVNTNTGSITHFKHFRGITSSHKGFLYTITSVFVCEVA